VRRGPRYRQDRRRAGVIWVREMLPKPDVIQILSHATVFVCPSIYEPMGIVNLEAMACEAAVVATGTGGIPEVVADGVTGLVVPIDQHEPGAAPRDPGRFSADIADRVNSLLHDPDRALAMGRAGRQRAVEHFSWAAIAARTAQLYHSVSSR
jgi:starch synthase